MRVSAVVLLFLCATAFTEPEQRVSPIVERFEADGADLLAEALEAVAASHAYRDRVPYDTLMHEMLAGIVNALDDRYAALAEAVTTGSRDGAAGGAAGETGLVLDNDEYGRLVVASLLSESPAEAAGVRPGDQVLRIAGTNALGLGAWEAMTLLASGSAGSVALVVASGSGNPRELLLPKPERPPRAVTVRIGSIRGGRWRDRSDGDVAWITIHAFIDVVLADQWDDVVRRVYAHPSVRSIILDLRDNGGGENASLSVLADFLPADAPMVTFEARFGSDGWEEHVRNGFTPRSRLLSFPVAVVVNNRTASLAEIFVAALRDVRDAPVVGERTYGKATTQTWLSVGERYALHLTVGRWRSPSGISYDQTGIEPDVAVQPSPWPRRDAQLQAAVDALDEWRVRAGSR